jgi:formate-dependent nitrite reductase membrane component NrfD
MDVLINYTVPHVISWDWRVALDLFFGGIGVGAFIFAVILDYFYGQKNLKIIQTAAFIAPVSALLGFFFLMLKFQYPFRLLHTFFSFNPTSPLWWGGIFQTIFIIGALYYASLWKTRAEFYVEYRQKVGLCTLPFAVIVGAYHGFLLSFISAKALWNTGPTLVSSILGFITTGIAAVLLVHIIRSKFESSDEPLQGSVLDFQFVYKILAGAIFLQLVTFFIWWTALVFGSHSAQQALEAANLRYGFVFWFGAIGLGLVIPVVLEIWGIFKGHFITSAWSMPVVCLMSVFILIGGYLFRWAVLMAGQLY